ncbi:MAG: hypothetical protein K0U36_05390 [Alphaproteobacteria bacterium]|nr:hypothetical protein [Alphaproteobacteria bacterium]
MKNTFAASAVERRPKGNSRARPQQGEVVSAKKDALEGSMHKKRCETYASLVEIIGVTAANRLVARFGGQSIYVPVNLLKRHALVHLLGEADATKLCEVYSGTMLCVPQMPGLRTEVLLDVLSQHYSDQDTLAWLAGVTPRRVRQMQKERRDLRRRARAEKRNVGRLVCHANETC